MQAAKKYWVWIVIGVVVLAALGFDLIHVGSMAKQVRGENESIVRSTREFENFVSQLKTQVPTPKDMEVGTGFLDEITAEGRRTSALWQCFAAGLDKGIQKQEVVYPDDDKQRAGTPVPAKFFADFLRPQYIKAMVDTELALQKTMTPGWEKMLAQSMYATDHRATQEKADAVGKESAPVVAAEEAHIFYPNQLIPFKLNEPFEQDQQKRWRYWRNFLLFRDILTRAVVNTSVQVRRDVIAFDRPGPDFDEATGKLGSDILTGKGYRFIENISRIDIRQTAVGDGLLPLFDAAVTTAPDGKPQPAAAGGSNGHVFYDVFNVTIELVAHIKVVEAFAHEILNTNDFYYVPLSQDLVRLPDAVTMTNYVMPTGSHAVTPMVSDAFAETKATPVNAALGFEHEPPVKAVLVFQVYRPRLPGAANPDTVGADKFAVEERPVGGNAGN